MLTKEKMKWIFVYAFMSLAVGLFVLCLWGFSDNLAFAEATTVGTTSTSVLGEEEAPISLNITGVKSKEYDGTNYVKLETNNNLEDLLIEADKSKNVKAYGVLASPDAGENIYIESVELKGDSALVGKYTISPTFKCERKATITKKSVALSFVPNNITATDGFYTVDYTGENFELKIGLYYVDILDSPVNVRFYCTTTTNTNEKTDLVNAGEYLVNAIAEAKDKNYQFNSSAIKFKIKTIDPTITFLKNEFVYTGEPQDLKDYVKVNNDVQTITCKTNTVFTTYAEGVALINTTFSVEKKGNYNSLSKNFAFTMKKAQPTFDLTNMPTIYEYSGEKIDVTRGVVCPNECALSQNIEIVNAGDYSVVLAVGESANYYSGSTSVNIKVKKKVIDLSDLTWAVPSYPMYYKWDKMQEYYTLLLANVNSVDQESVLDIVYSGNSQKDAGSYLASAVASLNSKAGSNYELNGAIRPLFFTINKRIIARPLVSSVTTFVYDGAEKSITFSTQGNESYYNVTGDKGVNADSYSAIVKLTNGANISWEDGSSDDLAFSWTIKKRVISVDEYKTVLTYNGSAQTLEIKENSLYYSIGDSATEIGEYKTLLILKDKANYAFDNEGNGEYTIRWKISGNKQTSGVPISLILVVTILVTGIGVYLTLRYTIVAKEKKARKKRLEQKLSKINKPNVK